uniref:Cytochrome b5 heme-binding domain-containing protein n=1 Tax=Acrobeloides nanus TaxID=290746 RepID=A0A914CUE6_9BILA
MTQVKKFTRAEVLEHNSNRTCWIIIGNKVYDVTKFLDEKFVQWMSQLKEERSFDE